jgi:hypothetical protein
VFTVTVGDVPEYVMVTGGVKVVPVPSGENFDELKADAVAKPELGVLAAAPAGSGVGITGVNRSGNVGCRGFVI